jgi:Ser/Thr protein kinase RdoA (MazF antagonist)
MFSYSRPTPETIVDRLLSFYEFGAEVRCRFYVPGLHDNYLVEEGRRQYILRLYRRDWRSAEDIRFELELLTFLHARDCPIAYPLPARDGKYFVHLACPEGQRAAALFPYAPGSAPGVDLSPEVSQLLGRTVARIHKEADEFTPGHTRQELDLEYLLDRSIRVISDYLTDQQRDTLEKMQADIQSNMPRVSRTAPLFGICSGAGFRELFAG